MIKGISFKKPWKAVILLAGLTLAGAAGTWSYHQFELWQATRTGASDSHLNDQARWLTQVVQTSLDRALEDAHDVSVSEGRHLPRSPGLLGVAWMGDDGVRFVWSDIDRPRVLSAKVEAVEALRKELLLSFSGDASASDEPVLLPLSTPPLFGGRADSKSKAQASRWLAVRIKSGADTAAAAAGAQSTPTAATQAIALLDSSRLFAEIPDSRARSLGGIYRVRVVEASSLAVLTASEPSDLAPRFRAGAGPSATEAPEGWMPTPGLLPVLRDFLSLGRVSSLGTHDGVRIKVQRTQNYPLLVMAEQHPEGMPVATPAQAKPARATPPSVKSNHANRTGNLLLLLAGLVFMMGFLGFAGIWGRRKLRARAWQKAQWDSGISEPLAEPVGAQGPSIALSDAEDPVASLLEITPVAAGGTIPGEVEPDSMATAELFEDTDMGTGAMAAGRPVFAFESQERSMETLESLRAENASLRQEVERLRHAQDGLLRNQELSRRTLEEIREEEKLLQDFETGALVQRHPRVIAEQAARTAHRLCGTPSLFFSVDPARGSARLVADSGLAENGRSAPASLEFQLEAEALETIAKITRDGSIASLSQYEPLARIVLMNFGVSHFDAWAVTGFSWLGRAAGKPSVLGILVLLQGSSQSLTQGRSLGRMLRNAGLVYENSLLAR